MLRRAARLLQPTTGTVGSAIAESHVFVGMPPKATSTSELFKGKKVFLLAIPGGYTSTCSVQLPQLASKAVAIKAAFNVESVLTVTTCDSFVCDSWMKSVNVSRDAVNVVSDPGKSLLKNLGHVVNLPMLGGDRFARVAMVIEDGTITKLWREKDGLDMQVTTADYILANPSGAP